MAKSETFTFRLDRRDRRLLEKLSEALQRSQSDAVRWLIREAVRELEAAGDILPNDQNGKKGIHHAPSSH